MMKTLFTSVVLLASLIVQQASAQFLGFEYKILEDKTGDFGLAQVTYDPKAFDDNVNSAAVAWFGQPMYSGFDKAPIGFVDEQAQQWNFTMKYNPGIGVGGDSTFGFVFPDATGEDLLTFTNDENGQFLIFTDPKGFAEKVPIEYGKVVFIPEPAAATLGLMGLLGMVGIARRRVRR